MTKRSPAFLQTKAAVLYTGLLCEPLMQAYMFIPFILRKDLGASVFQLAILSTLKYWPAIFLVYWSSQVNDRKDKLKNNVIWSGIFSRIPFLFFPFITSSWSCIVLAAIYMLFYKAGTPAWLEILRLNLPGKERAPLYAVGAAYAYAIGVLFLPLMGHWMDHDNELWRWVFPIVALVGMFSVPLQTRIPIEDEKLVKAPIQKISLWKKISQPWIKSYRLLKSRPDFAHFHWGYMLCGSGILITQPVVPILCVDYLKLSYTDFALALSVFKGLGLACASTVWGRVFQKISIFHVTGYVFILVGLFPLFLIFSTTSILWLFLAHLVYGIALAGNHVSWNLAGPSFAGDNDSSPFSTVNVVLLGLRACVAPTIGSILCHFFGPFFVLGLSSFCCLISASRMLQTSSKKILVS